MSPIIKTSLEGAIDLIQHRFLKKAWEARSNESVTVAFEIRRCLTVSADPDRFKHAYELLESALGRWREGFARVAEGSFQELCGLASAHPDRVETDPAEWARARINLLIAEELSGKIAHDVQWRAEEVEAAEAAANPIDRWTRGLVDRLTPAESRRDLVPVTDRPKPGRHLEWFARACGESDYVPPRDSAGQAEAWLAPSWVSGRPLLGRPWSDERTTISETNFVLREARSDFEHRAQYVLDDAVDKKRIEILVGPSQSRRAHPEQPRFRSELRKAIASYARLAETDREILTHMHKNHPDLVPSSWAANEKSAFDTFTKVRRALGIRRER